jgi:hypothetical protein
MKIPLSHDHKALIRRYLLWMFKTTKESFERIERKTTQLIVDEYILERVKTAKGVPANVKKEYDGLVEEFNTYIKTKRAKEHLHPQYPYLKNRLQAVEGAIRHFLGEKELRAMRSLYEKEFTGRILQAREH